MIGVALLFPGEVCKRRVSHMKRGAVSSISDIGGFTLSHSTNKFYVVFHIIGQAVRLSHPCSYHHNCYSPCLSFPSLCCSDLYTLFYLPSVQIQDGELATER